MRRRVEQQGDTHQRCVDYRRAAPTSAAQAAATSGPATATGGQPATGTSAAAADHERRAATSYKPGGTVIISNEQGQTWPCQFNPFNPAVNVEAVGFVYEPLVFVNALKSGAETPMLASSYTWSSDQKSIVFTIRDGVKWNDGQPFSAADVAYTFNLMKKNAALDLYALWSGAGLQQRHRRGNKVTMAFNQPAKPYFYNFADQVGIVPEHIFSAGDAAAHPDTWPDKAPVGTGPFMVNPCTPNNITYTANPHYWMPNEPHIQKVQYPAYLDNGPANLDLASGKAQWGSQFIPNIESFYLKKSKDNHYWFPPTQNVFLFPNNDPSHPATHNLAVRQAIAYALDRSTIAKIGESGYWPAGNQSGIVLPTFQKYYDAVGGDRGRLRQAQRRQGDLAAGQRRLLERQAAQAQRHHDHRLHRLGRLARRHQAAARPARHPADDPGPRAADLRQQVLQRQLRPRVRQRGRAAVRRRTTSCARCSTRRTPRPIGKQANGNYERYSNPAVDKLFDQYATADPPPRSP